MKQKDLRTYRRRKTTRTSGFHTCDTTTGGECRIAKAKQFRCIIPENVFVFSRSSLKLIELFEKGISVIAFGGYIHSTMRTDITIDISYSYENERYSFGNKRSFLIEENSWQNVGAHAEQIINKDPMITNIIVRMTVKCEVGNILDFICFDLDVVSKEEFLDTSCATSFYQRTKMHIPYLYYLASDLPFEKYLVNTYEFSVGRRVVLKSCNRCGRFLPINIDTEPKTLSFSLHCKKRAPCVHSTFRAYEILNRSQLMQTDLEGLRLERNKVVSYYGHQLECKACKKFFVNAPLNPQRNAQQFKEDGLRRRALEVLVNILLDKNLVHFEFERKTKMEFSRYIWEKFEKRCFKCGPSSKPIRLRDMALDHTMPLAYLYRLDETATCLCSSHNSQKSDSFPIDYYSKEELERLSKITGLPLSQLCTREVNQQVLDLLIKNVVWYFDCFLMNPDYQRIRDGILTADKINDSIKRVVAGKTDLAEEYYKKTGHRPHSVTLI